MKKLSLSEIQAMNTRLARDAEAYLAEVDAQVEADAELEEMFFEASISVDPGKIDELYSEKYPNITNQYWMYDTGIAEQDRIEADFQSAEWDAAHPEEVARYKAEQVAWQVETDRLHQEHLVNLAKYVGEEQPF